VRNGVRTCSRPRAQASTSCQTLGLANWTGSPHQDISGTVSRTDRSAPPGPHVFRDTF
jgi:hypothetical protein